MCYRSGAISIDNEIVGDPDIECLDDQIRVFVKTRKLFTGLLFSSYFACCSSVSDRSQIANNSPKRSVQGRIYAKGKADNPDCSKDDFARERTKKPYMELKFGMCGMKSLRSVDPRGMYYGITLVVSFHTMFITKVDQAFHVKCFFEEASRGLTAELGVSMIPTTEVEARHSIPGCSYSIHASSIAELDAGKPAGPPIHQMFVPEMFGILINNCYVTDGFGKRADVVDSRGCAVDPILITGIRYSADLQRAYAESQVFKFADRPGVWFFCQIQMCMKKAGMCDGVTPPGCASAVPKTLSAGGLEEGYDREVESNSVTGGGAGGRHGSSNQPIGLSETSKRTAEPFQFNGATPFGLSPNPEDYETANEHGTGYGAGFPLPHAFEKNGGLDYGTAHRPGFGNQKPTTATPRRSTIDKNIPEWQGRKTIEDNNKRVSQIQAVVTNVFETNEHYVDQKYGTTQPRYGTTRPHVAPVKNGYIDYDNEDVTIPPNLNDLLANLPDDVDADSLQKMFRDSVADRRALLQGFDMLRSQKTSWGRSARLADSPLQYDDEAVDDAGSVMDSSVMSDDLNEPPVDADAPPMIAGRLLIYDIDEEPPKAAANRDDRDDSSSQTLGASKDCVISRHGLFLLATMLGSLCALLFIIAIFLYIRLSRTTSAFLRGWLVLSDSSAHLQLDLNITNLMKFL
ncbi:unnamed protein product [Anisakis simplex]|uniref:ZP domain-containing protein n=1 Tax=Anisakis simplex TaxID=6269 RepID=A0A158PPC5_ANISI|nr:unnamed protein product [Anisakis simplex]